MAVLPVASGDSCVQRGEISSQQQGGKGKRGWLPGLVQNPEKHIVVMRGPCW